MKNKTKYILFWLLLFVFGAQNNIFAYNSLVTASGQIIYWQGTGGNDPYATIVPPDNNYYNHDLVVLASDYEPWSGYSKPGGRLVIPDSIFFQGTMFPVRYISRFAFYKCSNLTSVIIPNTVTEIGGRAFSQCDGLISVTIGTNVNKIESYAFYSNNSSLDTVYYYANSCQGLVESGGSTLIWRTTNTATLIVGDNVSQIKTKVFMGSCGFKHIVIGSSLSQIGQYNSFRNLTPDGSTTTVFKCQNPPLLAAGVSFGTDTNTCTVPCGRSTFYYNQWSTRFASYNEMPTGVSVSVGVSNSNYGVAQIEQDAGCDSIAIISATPYYGYLFTQWSDGNNDNPRTVYLTNPSQQFIAQFSRNPGEPDTVYIHDTTIITNHIHDTTYLPIYLHDTIPMIEYLHDTIYLPQYIYDTAIVNHYFHDTIYLPQYIHDTTIVTELDTAYITLHDTTIVNNYLRDTIYLPLYFHDTMYITQTDTVTNMVYDTVTNTVYDTVINTLYDTINNYIYDTTIVTDTLWLTLYDTIYITDTLIIHDTVYVPQDGIGDVETLNAKIYTHSCQIVVEGAKGNTVTLYDVTGRVLATKQDDYAPLHFEVPASGTYMIKIGLYPARKVVVIR